MRAGRVGRCVSAFLAAVVLDVLGLVVLFVGIFADLRVDGEFYGDFLVYSGSLGIFSSLAFWVVWYIGNIQGSDDAVDSGHLRKTGSLVQLARKLSERLNGTRRDEAPRARSVEEADSGRVDVSLRKASKVTWGKSTAYVNGGYDGDGLDAFPPYDETKKRPAIPQRDSMSPPTTGRRKPLAHAPSKSHDKPSPLNTREPRGDTPFSCGVLCSLSCRHLDGLEGTLESDENPELYPT